MRETIEIYKGRILAINPEDFEAGLYRDDAEKPFALGTFHRHIVDKKDLPFLIAGGRFIFEIYRENGNVKWSITFGDPSNNKNK